MDDLSVRNKHTVTTVTTSGKNTKTGNSGTTDFASLLVFGTGSMNNNMSMKSNSSQNEAVYDDGGNAGYDRSYRDDREARTDHTRDDAGTRERADDHDYRRDDTPRRDKVSSEDRQHSDQSGRDEHRNSDSAPRDERASNDNTSSQESAASEQSQPTSTNGETSGNQQGQTNQNTHTDNVGNKMAQGAVDTFIHGAETQTQTAANPAMAAMAGQNQTNNQANQSTQNPQAVQNIDANASSNKDLFSNGWQNNTGKQAAQSANNQTQGQQQGQPGAAGQQGFDPQAQGQLTGEAQKQAADLAKKLAQGQRAQVNVNVTNQGNEMSSAQSQNLSNATQVATEANNPLANATKQNNQKAGTNPQAQNVQVAAANTQTQNVQQNNNQNNQTQSFQSMVGDVKGAAKAQTVQQPQAVNPEAAQTAAATSTNKTQTTQQTTENKSVAQHKPEVHTTAKPEEISVEINKAAKAGLDRIKIQLKPLELGRIEVQLDMSSGKVVTTIIAERPETLQMLKNDASDLAKSLTEAGLNMGDMNFNLKHENKEGQQAGEGAKGGNFADENAAENAEEELLLASEMELLAKRAQERAAARGGVDLSA